MVASSPVLPTNEVRALVALSLAPGLGPTVVRRLLSLYPDPVALLHNPADIPATEACDLSVLRKIGALPIDALLASADMQLREAEKRGVTIVTCLDVGYPVNLAEAPGAPPVLYVRGWLSAQDTLSVAVVGTREASDEGRVRARKIASLLAERGVAVVSGLARGIDTEAHWSALSKYGRTIAVVGCGLDRTYPSENAALAEAISEQGALISQFPFGTPPTAHNFPMRNKTMALLSLATVVVEAGPVSGAKMQADFALRTEEPKRAVFLMKSLIDAQGEAGWPQEFLQRGAQRMDGIQDVLQVLPASSAARKSPQLPLFHF